MSRLATALAALLLFATAVGYGGRWHPLLVIAANFRLHLALLGAGLGVVAALMSLRRAAGLALLTAGLAAGGLGPVYAPVRDAGPLPEGGRSITLLYANLWERNPTPEKLRAELGAIDADILISSETTRRLAGPAAAPDGLWTVYPYRATRGAGGKTLRTAIWSKFPLSGARVYLDNSAGPTAAAAAADLGGGLRLGLVGVHFSHPHRGHEKVQVEGMRRIVAGLPRPLVVAGDFNGSPWSQVVSRTAELTGTRPIGGYRVTWRGTYPTPVGPLPEFWGHDIDQVLISPGIAVEDISTIALPGSDHRGVLVRLHVAPP